MSRDDKVGAESIDTATPNSVRRPCQHHRGGHHRGSARPARRQRDNDAPVTRLAAGQAKPVTPGRRVPSPPAGPLTEPHPAHHPRGTRPMPIAAVAFAVLVALVAGIAAGWALRGHTCWCPTSGASKTCPECDPRAPTTAGRLPHDRALQGQHR